jgi:hypothetical protein
MAFSNIDGQNLGKFLQIVFSEGIRNQISRDFRDFEMVKQARVNTAMARSVRFFIQKSFGPSAVQYRNPNFSANFPSSQQINTQEHEAFFKELDATVEIEYNMWKRAQMSKDARYAEPLAVEMESKLIALKRQLAKDLYGDGTGVMGQLAASAVTVEGGNLRIQLETANGARGHVGFFEYDELLVLKTNAGGTSVLDTNLATEPAYYKVLERRRSDDTVLLQPLDSSLVALTVASITTQPATGDVLYKYEQPTVPNLGSIADYGTITEVIPGLESLTADDGRVIHGLTMTGAVKGTRLDAADVQVDVSHLEAVMNDVKINVGGGQYAWKMALMAPEAYSQFVESRETDRRFNSIEDSTRGVRKFVYQHREDAIELYASEYCPKKRMYILPEAKAGQGKVIESHMTDFEPVRAAGGSELHLKPGSGGGHERRMVSYMEGYGTMVCRHPAAVAVIENFRID